MSYLPHTDIERREMLDAIGVETLEALYADVPANARFPEFELPEPLSELQLERHMRALAEQNRHGNESISYLGAGAYEHYIPAAVNEVISRNEFYTAYTPYQAEASQGILQAMFEYQTMICRLTGMDVANASHYDGATALAEAVRMALNAVPRERSRVIVSPTVNPRYREVVQTYLMATDAEIVGERTVAANLGASLDDLTALLDHESAALVIQNPNFLGQFENIAGLADTVHNAGALLIVVADPIALGRFQAPGSYGADVVVADGQPLGIPLSFGGPHLGVFAARQAYVHKLPGRLVGETQDADGRRGYVLTLAAREQHIRRARATSNICTNSGLMALAATTYMATLGERGLQQVAELCYHKSHYAAAKIAEIRGCEVNPQAPAQSFFKEFVVSLPRSVSAVNEILLNDFGILGGFDLEASYPAFKNHMLIAVTEKRTKADIDRLVSGLHRALA